MADAIDRKILDESVALGDEESWKLLTELNALLKTTTPERLKGIAQGLARNLPALVAAEAHNLKSSSGSLGATEMSAICLQIEQLGRAATLGPVPELLKKLEAEYARVQSELDALIATRGRKAA